MEIQSKDTYSIFVIEAANEANQQAIQSHLENQDAVVVIQALPTLDDSICEWVESLQAKAESEEKCIVFVHEEVSWMEGLEDYGICLPTLSEAHDYVYMEQLQRNF